MIWHFLPVSPHPIVHVIVDVQVHLEVVKIGPNDSPDPKKYKFDSRSKSLSVSEAKLWSIYSMKLAMNLPYMLLLMFRLIWGLLK